MKYDYEEQDSKYPLFGWILLLVLMMLIFLIYSNIKLMNQVNILDQQLASLTQSSSTTGSVTEDDVSAIRKQIGNLQDSSYEIGLKVNSVERTLDDITSFIGLDAKQQKERDEIINQIKRN